MAASLVLSAAAMGSSAFAQEGASFDAQTFRPAAGPHSIFTLDTSGVLGHLDPSGAAVLNYTSRPLMLEQGGEKVALIDQQLGMHLVAGVGLFDLVELEVGLPVYFINDSELSTSDIEGGVVGDINITPKVQILSRENSPVGLAAKVDVTAPTGDENALVGKGSVTAAPGVIVDYQLANIVFATNLGVRIMEENGIGNLKGSDRFEYGVGAEAGFLDGLLRVGGELYGSTQLSEFFGQKEEDPLEGILGAKVVTDSGFSILAGGGAGFISGVGSPEFRGFVGLGYTVMPTEEAPEPTEEPVEEEQEVIADRDGDGVPDDEDECPDEPGPAENNGCPVEEEEEPLPDRDGDGVPDVDDECPDEPGPAENNGCPLEPDRDGDGIPDAVDKCPDEPGVEEYDGCPPPPEEVTATREREEIKITNKVYFEMGEATLKEESYSLLDQVALVLRTNPDITKIEIAGHTDRVGPADENQVLSEERAQAVKDYLVEKGIAAERLEPKGYGEMEPEVNPEGAKDQAENRRVEFKILEQSDEFKK